MNNVASGNDVAAADKILPTINEAITTEESMEQTIHACVRRHQTDECKGHLASSKLWEGIKSLLSSVVAHLIDQKASDVASLKSKVNAFIASLTQYSSYEFQFPSSYWALMKAVRNIRRPYHAQTLAAVKLVRELATHFSKSSPEKKTELMIQQLVEATIEAVQAAITNAAPVVTI